MVTGKRNAARWRVFVLGAVIGGANGVVLSLADVPLWVSLYVAMLVGVLIGLVAALARGADRSVRGGRRHDGPPV